VQVEATAFFVRKMEGSAARWDCWPASARLPATTSRGSPVSDSLAPHVRSSFAIESLEWRPILRRWPGRTSRAADQARIDLICATTH
jgi:hypothetical protein